MLQEEENLEEPKAKRKRVEENETTKEETKQNSSSSAKPKNYNINKSLVPRTIETGFFSKIPPELFHHILKFLSSEVWGSKKLFSYGSLCITNCLSDYLT